MRRRVRMERSKGVKGKARRREPGGLARVPQGPCPTAVPCRAQGLFLISSPWLRESCGRAARVITYVHINAGTKAGNLDISVRNGVTHDMAYHLLTTPESWCCTFGQLLARADNGREVLWARPFGQLLALARRG